MTVVFGDVEGDVVHDCSTCRHRDSGFAYCEEVKRWHEYNEKCRNVRRINVTLPLGSGCKFWGYKPKGFWARVGNVGWLVVDFGKLGLTKK